jgi:lactose/L-arabinose transport system ATP-binding protein
VTTTVGLPASEGGTQVTVGLRPQHLKIGPGDTHRVELTEALGGVSYVHLTAPSGEKLASSAAMQPMPALVTA